MGRMAIVAFAVAIPACSGGGAPPAPNVGTPAGGNSSGFGGSSSGIIGTTELAGVCPDQGDAAACPELGGAPAWVGCVRIVEGTNAAGFQSCTCFATETGTGAWACEIADANPTLPEASAPMTTEPVPPPCEACVKTVSSDAAPDAPDASSDAASEQ